jgi:predicted GNAT family acetyltransferase
VADLAALAPDLPSVLGPAASVGPFADRWSAVTGRGAELQVAERIYRLSRVIPAPAVQGTWRLAGEEDHDRLLAWARAFHDEALPGSPIVGLEAMVERWVRRRGRLAYLWEVEDRAVSLVVAGARTPNGRRIGPVYTPPEARGHGYATALTAAASQDQLDRGHAFCFLFTDLANPTSNAIYRRIGYEAVADVDQVRFVDRPEDGPAGAVSPP